MSEARWAEVLVEIEVSTVDRLYSYIVPDHLVHSARPGVRVLVPFGNRRLLGYLVSLGEDAPPPVPMKKIIDVYDRKRVFNGELWDLANWMAQRYLCTRAAAMRCILPPLVKGNGAREQIIMPAEELEEIPASLKRAPAQTRLLKAAMAEPGLGKRELAQKAGVSPGLVDALLAKGLLTAVEVKTRKETALTPGHTLNAGQSGVLHAIEDSILAMRRQVMLLHGITGSGKTEIYLRAASRTLAEGRQALVLVPEIALTPQMVESFQNRFGDRVALLHSRLADGERHRTWQMIMTGEKSVVLGTRSAVFAPLDKIGLLVLDEEHEITYKQEDQPRYHARVVAGWRAIRNEAVLLLGSATPSVESYRQAKTGAYRLLTLTSRIDNRPLPPVKLVDLRGEMKEGRVGLLSRELVLAVQGSLSRGEQSILFLNRRGYHTFLICRSCGQVLRCPHCAISLTYHQSGKLKCHYCNYTLNIPKNCNRCGGELLRFGAGTQRVEEEVQRLFPGARILRMDADTTSRKDACAKILSTFASGEADILVGTQMIAKGLDLPRVTSVGVVNADISLNMPDFRAAERTFQLLTQVAGRAGRGDLPGVVLVQTYNPDHYSVSLVARHDYEQFWAKESEIRRKYKYPPFGHLIRVVLSDPREETAGEGAALLSRCLTELEANDEVGILGPVPAPVSRIRDYYRYQLMLKGTRGDKLRSLLRRGLDLFFSRTSHRFVVTVDVDPQWMM